LSIRRLNDPGRLNDAAAIIQSDLLLIEDYTVAIHSDAQNQLWNRTTIGLTGAGELVLAGVFSANSLAFTLKQFADALGELRMAQGLDIRWALNMDGAYASFLSLPLPDFNKCFGSCSLMNVGSTIHFSAR
jgi:hypothetical protein